MSSGLDDRYAAGYEDGMQEYVKLHTVQRCAAFFTPHLRPGMSLLDAGFGPGTITVGLAPLIAPGAALSPSMRARMSWKRRLRSSPRLDSAQRTSTSPMFKNLPFEDCSFDAVFSHAVLDYVPDPSFKPT